MPVSPLASESDIQGTDILTMGVVIHIRITDITGRGTSGRHFIGTAVIAFTIRGRTIGTIIAASNKPKRPGDF